MKNLNCLPHHKKKLAVGRVMQTMNWEETWFLEETLYTLQTTNLKGLWHGQKWLQLFVDSEAYHKQMGPIPRLNGSLDITLSNAYLELSVTHFSDRHQNWPRDRKLTQSCWCLRWFLDLGADVWKILLHEVHTRLVVTQVYIEKMFNKNIEIGFQSAVFHLCERALVPLLRNDRGLNATASI